MQRMNSAQIQWITLKTNVEFSCKVEAKLQNNISWRSKGSASSRARVAGRQNEPGAVKRRTLASAGCAGDCRLEVGFPVIDPFLSECEGFSFSFDLR